VTAKTEEPTPKRLRRAREDGELGSSAALTSAVVFGAVLFLLVRNVGPMAARFAEALAKACRSAALERPPVELAAAITAQLGAPLVPLLVAGASVAVGTAALQNRFYFGVRPLRFDASRLDPVAGALRLFSGPRLFSVVRALALAGSIAVLAWLLLRQNAYSMATAIGDRERALAVGWAMTLKLIGGTTCLFVGAALVDAVVVSRSHRKRLRMTKAEVSREHRENEGNPEIKTARERAHREALTATIAAEVRRATVVIVNPTHVACALRYDGDDDSAPTVVARGQGDLAAAIVRAAHTYKVPIVTDVPLARALVLLEVGEQIPESMYEVVAEILRDLASSDGSGA
jgi:type III secretion protein U